LKQPKRPDASRLRSSLVQDAVQACLAWAPRDTQAAMTAKLTAAIAGSLPPGPPTLIPDRRPSRRRRRPLIDKEEWQHWKAVFDVANAMRKYVADADAERQLGAWSPRAEGFPLLPALVGALSLLARRATGVSMNLPTLLWAERELAVGFLKRAGQCAPPFTVFGAYVADLFSRRPDAVDRVRRCEHCGALFLDASSTFLVQPARFCSPSHKALAWKNRRKHRRKRSRPLPPGNYPVRRKRKLSPR
jgi:hypothetical protein